MKWQLGREGEVEDRRGKGIGATHVIGGGGLGVVVIALIGYFVFGIDPSQILNASQSVQSTGEQQTVAQSTCATDDTQCRFASTIHTSADDTWAEIFKSEGREYQPSAIVLYSEGTQTGCGLGESAMGPFYCPQDQRVYLDLDFFNTMDQQLGAKGDFARAYVIAHEVGHHVQNLLGTSDKVQQLERTQGTTGANSPSVKLELQADCYAGVWAKRSNDEKHWIEDGDIEEAINAASSVGDDTLQEKSQGRVVPDSFTHGTSAQRMKWFKAGFASGDPAACDTFS
ncbi:MAG: neutral zinc metallopeptidase [Asticcacaulis sp.]|uniref:KPN_02809 family neutral zinc metallopeptidase n=1 Tax=Asticcacaulis sp. TaxID=1872648 RepID=UPI0039E716F9